MPLFINSDLWTPPPSSTIHQASRKCHRQSQFDENSLARLFGENACIEIMELALQTPVEIDCITETEAIRDCFHGVRTRCKIRGDRRFDYLTFQVEDCWLLIYLRRHGDPRLCGGMWAVRSGARFCVNEHEIIRQR